jgi:hypothetical protein
MKSAEEYAKQKTSTNSPKRRTFFKLHSVTTLKTALFVVTAVRNSNPISIGPIMITNFHSKVLVLKYFLSLALLSNLTKLPTDMQRINPMHALVPRNNSLLSLVVPCIFRRISLMPP